MHLLKIKRYILFIPLFLITTILPAQDFRISGGLNYSTALCSNGDLYAWGCNTSTRVSATIGGLGTNSTAANVLLPEKVLFPSNDPYFKGVLGVSNVFINAVDAGTGATIIALDSKSGVWSVGYNNLSYFRPNAGDTVVTGTGSSAETTTQMARVLKGEYTGTPFHPSLSNYLTNVTSVTGGNLSSYAILATGEAMAWGINYSGQLGNGTYDHSATPKYVRTSAGTTLKNIIQIEAGDNTGYALVDSDGDGVGTVYSWGAGLNGELGRLDNGTVSDNNFLDKSNYAKEVLLRSGVPLNNIVSISASNTACFALDADGYVWAWGNNAWGGLCGIGNGGNYCIPKKVLAGLWATTPGNENEIYLKARSIAGGQGFAMAVSIDGIPLAWGNNGVTIFDNAPSGGIIGNGNTATYVYMIPQIILTGPGTYDSDVLSITDGDVCGFYTTSSGTIKTWGYNGTGQLGIGNKITQYYATPFTTLNTCSIPDPKPFALITSDRTNTCPFNTDGPLLDAGFEVAHPLSSKYQYKWYKNNEVIAGATTTTYKIQIAGTYTVSVSYIGSSTPVNTTYPDATSTIIITEVPATVSSFTPVENSYCDTTGLHTFSVVGYPGNPTDYTWYSQSNGGSPLFINDENYVSNTITINLKNTEKNGTVYRLWAEDATKLDIHIADKPTCTGTYLNLATNITATQFSLSQTNRIKLKSIDVSPYLVQVNPASYKIVIYANDENDEPEFDNIISESETLTFNTPAQKLTLEANIDLSELIAGNKYWLGITFVSGSIQCLDYSSCSATLPISDNEGMNILTITKNYSSNTVNSNIGAFYNFNITRAADNVCKRVEVDLHYALDTSVARIDQSLSANQLNATYQWIDWDNNAAIIPEATEQTFIPLASGNYGVIVSTEDCSDTSGIHNFVYSISTKNALQKSSTTLVVYPNPATKNFTIQLPENKPYLLSLINGTGQVIIEKTVSGIHTELTTENLNSGIYIVKISNDSISLTQQILIIK